jgi:hypothetical protein
MKKPVFFLLCVLALVIGFSPMVGVVWLVWPRPAPEVLPVSAKTAVQIRADLIALGVARTAAQDPGNPHLLLGVGGPSATTEIILSLGPQNGWPADKHQQISSAIEAAILRGFSLFKLVQILPAEDEVAKS